MEKGISLNIRSQFIPLIMILAVLVLGIDIKIIPIGPLNLSTAELSLLLIIVIPILFYREKTIKLLKENKGGVIACGTFLFVGALSTLLSQSYTLYAFKCFARYVVIALAIGQLSVYYSGEEKFYLFFKLLFSLAGIFSIISILEAYIPELGNALARIFREGSEAYINGKLRPSATLNHPNILACFNVLSIFLGALLLEKKKITTWFFWLVGTIIIISVCLGSSRNSFIAFTSGLLILGITKEHRKMSISLFMVFLGMYLLFSPSLKRAGDFRDNASFSRLMLWESALRMSSDHPFLGVGPGCYNKFLINYAQPELIDNEKENVERGTLNAHNGVLNILAEFGILGLLSVAYIFVWYFKAFLKVRTFAYHAMLYVLVVTALMPFLFDAFFYSYFHMTIVGSILLLLVQKENVVPPVI